MVKIKRNTDEYKQWLRHRNARRLNLRTRKKAWRKQRITSLQEYNCNLKRSVDYEPKTKRYTVTAPLVFSFVKNPEATLKFFSTLLQIITRRENIGTHFYIDISKITTLTSDALMYLLAIVNNIDENVERNLSFSGNAPDDPNIRKRFSESGFYQYVKRRDTSPLTQNKDNLQIVSGEKCDTSIARQIVDFVCKKADVAKLQCRFMYNMLIELMSNTHKHAYSERRRVLFPRWYCFSEFDGGDKISFTFMDTGAGIPATVRKKLVEKIDFLHLSGDSKFVTSALDGQFRTATGKTFRGKGLPKIREFCTQSKIQNMRIITNHADVSVFADRYRSHNMDSSLRGTLYCWEISISSLKGDMT